MCTPGRSLPALLALLAAGPAAAAAAGPPAPGASGPMLVETAEGARLLYEGRAHLHALRLDAADSAFVRLDALEAESPAGAYHRATAALWRAMLEEREPFLRRHDEAADALEARAQALPEGGPEGVWRSFFEGEAALQRAILAGRQERYLPAATSFRRACGRYRDALRADPAFEEAYLGAGICHVAAGQIPRKYRWIARLLGFTGTVAEGTAELDRAAEHAAFVGETAAVARAILRAIYEDDDEAAIAADAAALRAGHPDSPMAAYVAGFLLLRARRAEAAEAALATATAMQAAAGATAVPPVAALHGFALFRLERYDEAAARLEHFLATFRGKSFVAQARLTLGLAHEMRGDRAAAEAAYRRVRAERDYDNDLAAAREARRRLQHPMDDRDRALVRGQNLFDAGRYRDAVAAVQPLFGDAAASEGQRAEAAYRSGRAFQAQQAWAEAARHSRIAADSPGDADARWGPWSRFHLGEVLAAQGDREGARRAFRAVLADEHEFDFHQALEQRARAALERLG
jgi:tetratricopeptide (TPR) repeat protein